MHRDDDANSSGNEEVAISNRKLRQMKLKDQRSKKSQGPSATPRPVETESCSEQAIERESSQSSVAYGWEHDQQPTMLSAISITYCPDCGYPRDFCDFGPCWDKCKTAALSQYPQFYSQYLTVHPEERPKASIETTNAKDTDQCSPTEAQCSDSTRQSSSPRNLCNQTQTPQVQQVQKSKKNKDVVKQVTVQRVSRAKHKVATIVCGLELFDVKVDIAAKTFKKKFACGCSAVKGLPGQQNHVEIQGDFENEIDQVILENFSQVSESSIVHLSPK